VWRSSSDISSRVANKYIKTSEKETLARYQAQSHKLAILEHWQKKETYFALKKNFALFYFFAGFFLLAFFFAGISLGIEHYYLTIAKAVI
jgi:hypothetical protein